MQLTNFKQDIIAHIQALQQKLYTSYRL